jgi:hypothetical protein
MRTGRNGLRVIKTRILMLAFSDGREYVARESEEKAESAKRNIAIGVQWRVQLLSRAIATSPSETLVSSSVTTSR